MRYLILFLFSITAFATLNEVDKQAIWGKNILSNGGFENGKAGWTASGGTFALVTSSTNLLTGKVSATWDSGSAAQTLTAVATIPQGLYGKNGVAVCKTQTPSGTATHTLGVTATAGTLVSSAITSSTTPVYDYRSFIFPSSGSVTIAITSVAADEPLIAIDDCFLGDASEVNLSNISQAQFIGSAYIPVTANCLWSRSNTAIGAFTSDADCPGPTVEVNPGPGTIQTTDADLPQFTVNNLPPGTYQVIIAGPGIPTGSNAYVAYAIYDGTDTRGEQGGASSLTTMTGPFSIVGTFTYSSAGNRTFAVHGRASANTVNIDPRSHRVHFSIYRFPTTSELAYRPDAIAFNWSGFHSNDCSFTRSSSSYGQLTGDSSCTFTEQTNSNMGTVSSTFNGGVSLSPGISFQTTKATTYHVCANANYDADGNNVNWQMIEKTSGVTIVSGVYQQVTSGQFVNMQMCGNLDVDSVQTTSIEIQCKAASGACALTPNGTSGDKTVQWSIFGISQSLPAPLLVNSVTSNSSGVEGIHRAFITNTGTPTISSGDQSGDWIDSITDGAAGVVTVNFKAGVFSRKPACTAMCVHNGTNCTVFAYNNTVEPSTTSIQLVTRNSAGTGVDEDIMLICMGPR